MTNVNDIKSFFEGRMCDAYRFFGSRTIGDKTHFSVYAPGADRAFLKLGDKMLPMENNFGVWTCLTGEEVSGYRYVFEKDGCFFEKNDPFAFSVKNRVSEVYDISGISVPALKKKNEYMNIYELHIGSWQEGGSFSSVAESLGRYVSERGYNYVELMPVHFHPCVESWGYQATGYFAFQYGSPHDFAEFVAKMHSFGIGVIVDWVPGHFACDSFGLSAFDGTPLFESEDKALAYNRMWGSVNTDFSKPEVCSFFLSSACFLTDVFGIDGIRVDAVSNMIVKYFEGYRDNYTDGNINCAAVDFLRTFTGEMKKRNVLTVAEDCFGGLSATGIGGLGFDRVWNMGWFHDTVLYLSAPSVARVSLESFLLKPFGYMNNERYILPLSHDENVHGKKSVFGKLPDDNGRSYRLLLMYMTAFPGDKLTFSGTEYGAEDEWNGLSPQKKGILSSEIEKYCVLLNNLLSNEKSLQTGTCVMDGFENGVLKLTRYGDEEDDFLIFVFNFSNTGYDKYCVGIDRFTDYREMLVTSQERDLRIYSPVAYEADNKNFRTEVNLPPLCGLVLKPVFPGKKI